MGLFWSESSYLLATVQFRFVGFVSEVWLAAKSLTSPVPQSITSTTRHLFLQHSAFRSPAASLGWPGFLTPNPSDSPYVMLSCKEVLS